MNYFPYAIKELVGKCHGMGGNDDIVQFEQGIVRWGWFLVKDVYSSSLYPLLLQRFYQCRLINDGSSGRVYQEG